MRAVAVSAGGSLEVVERPDPEAGAGEVVVAVERCGICGSDLHLLRSGLLRPGAVLGHEIAGTVAALGPAPAPATLTVGQRVAVLPARRCGTCRECRRGRANICPAQAMTGIGLGVNDGGFAEYVRVPAASCHPVAPATPAGDAALVEPYAVALHALARAGLVAGAPPGGAGAGPPEAGPGAGAGAGVGPASVVAGVIGAGSVGLACVVALVAAGVGRVAVAEPAPERAGAAAALGAVVVDDARRLGRAAGEAPAVVLDTTGTAATPALALEAVAPGGRVVLLGVVGPAQALAMPGLAWLLKEVAVVASIAYTDAEFAAAARAAGAGALRPLAARAAVRPLEEADRSVAELTGGNPPVKVLLAP